MSVSDAVDRRQSTRGYLDREVPIDVLRDILARALRSPSGGNLQPWHVYALAGQPLADLVDDVMAKLPTAGFGGDGDFEYAVYPASLGDPYLNRRFRAGEDLYKALSIPREDKARRRQQFVENFRFFGARVGLFFYIDRNMGAPQWSDLGMLMQTVMLLATERGLATCAQEAWSIWHKTVRAHVGAPPQLMLFSGMALGYPDPEHPTASVRTDRAALDEMVSFRGWA
nr:nitroreductase [Sphingomonas tagetis]